MKKGDYVKFGSYPQNNSEVKEPIEWLVLEVNSHETLLVSRYGLDCKRHHHEFTEITWENCDLRKWLNADFLKAAFSEEEQQRIRLSDVVNDDNRKYGTSGGNNTRDRIFCLSLAEAERYFKNDDERKCQPAALTKVHIPKVTENNYCSWWLRSPGDDPRYAAFVSPDGVSWPIGDCISDIDGNVARPALWVNL